MRERDERDEDEEAGDDPVRVPSATGSGRPRAPLFAPLGVVLALFAFGILVPTRVAEAGPRCAAHTEAARPPVVAPRSTDAPRTTGGVVAPTHSSIATCATCCSAGLVASTPIR